MRHSLAVLSIAALCAGLAVKTLSPALAAEAAVVAPAPATDEPLKPGPLKTAVFAGGCFWGVEGVFQHVKGVVSARAGYAGGAASTARYELVGTEMTGHAESVEVKYDPAKVSYGTLLRVFFSVAHDPTQLNRQGPDSGPSYRSAIFPVDATQASLARAYIAQLSAAKVWPGKIVTTIEPGKTFYPAEAYHQNFLNQNPDYPYIVVNDLPKLAAFKRLLPQLWNDKSAA
jgi:peptide-methionine (S)-S-oxide reductase